MPTRQIKEAEKLMKKINWALIGYGGMGNWHVKQLQTMPEEINICGVYDILPEKNKAAEENGLKAYPSLEALLADPQIELVTIATPNDVHESIAIQAMDAGKNVISEKPVTLTCASLQRMIDASKRNGVKFSVHQNRRWDEDYLVAKKLYEENTLGKIFRIESRVHGSRGIPGDWRNKKAQGGGMVFDWGIHLFDQILMLTGGMKVTSVYAMESNVTNEEVDDGFTVVLTFEDGLKVLVEVGTSNFIGLPRWYILGENGSARCGWNVEKGKITMVSDWEKRDAVPVVTAAGLTKTMAPRTSDTIKEYPLPRIESDVREYYINFIKAICGEEEQFVTHEQMMRDLTLVEAVFESAAKNEVIKREI